MVEGQAPEEEHHHSVSYADHEVEEFDDTGIPTFLKWVYVILPIWGVFWFYMYWDGSAGFLDRGYWRDLEKAANTTIQKVDGSSSIKKFSRASKDDANEQTAF